MMLDCISLLTHGCQAPPDTPQGSPMDWGRALELRKRDLSSQLRHVFFTHTRRTSIDVRDLLQLACSRTAARRPPTHLRAAPWTRRAPWSCASATSAASSGQPTVAWSDVALKVMECISLLTHGCQAPPDTPQGSPMDWGRALELRKRDLSSQLRSAQFCMVRWGFASGRMHQPAHARLPGAPGHPSGQPHGLGPRP